MASRTRIIAPFILSYFVMDDLQIKIKLYRLLFQQEARDQNVEEIDTCRTYHGKLFLLKAYNVLLNNKPKINRDRNDYIKNSHVYRKNISKHS
jgi:hypothetical protein